LHPETVALISASFPPKSLSAALVPRAGAVSVLSALFGGGSAAAEYRRLIESALSFHQEVSDGGHGAPIHHAPLQGPSFERAGGQRAEVPMVDFGQLITAGEPDRNLFRIRIWWQHQ
jgi:hypothetical protein